MKIAPAVVVTAVLSVSCLINPGIAGAHDWVVSTTPAENSTGPAPSAVSLTFNEPVTNAEVWVTAADHSAWSTGSVTGSGSTYSIPLRPGLPAGEYTVHWKNNAADGDDVHSSWLFTVR